MKVEHVEFYDYFDTYCKHVAEAALYDMEFDSLYHVALTVREMLGSKDKPVFRQALVFMNNWRYLLVTTKTFDVHYHATFDMMEKQIGKPLYNIIK